MESIFWLLPILLIVGILAAYKPLSRRYKGYRVDVSTRVREARKQLFRRWEDLWIYNKVYLESYSDQDAGRYGQRAQEYRQNFLQARDSLLFSLREQTRINRGLPRWEKPSLKNWLMEIGRLPKWWRANRDHDRLQADIQRQDLQIEKVKRSLQALKDLPLEAANLARETRDLCGETSDLLDILSKEEGLGGRNMEEALQLVKNTKEDLEKIPGFFFNLTAEELASQPDVKSETLNALLILEPARGSLDILNKQAKDWQSNTEELRKADTILQARVRETDTIFNRLNRPLVLSGEQEELSMLRQKADEVHANLAALTVENLGPTRDEAKRTVDGLTLLTQTLNVYEERLKKLQDLLAKINEQLQAVDNTMKTASVRQEYPLVWTTSQSAFEAVKERLASIPVLSERRVPAELLKNVETAEACASSLVNLEAAINKVTVELGQSDKLWSQLRPVYTEQWLAGVEQLFSDVKKYDMASNWESADGAGSVYDDACELLKRANENIPSAKSIPIYEQQVASKRQTAQELIEAKPLFDDRKSRIETRLKQLQEEEEEARGIHERVAPAVILFARKIRTNDIPTKQAQNLLAADATRVALEKSLKQRNVGNVSTKLEDVRRWERSSAENGALVYRWVEDDLLKRKVSVSANLREIETFAEDLEDDVVVRGHKYDLVFAPQYSDMEQLKKQSLDAIQDDAQNLFTEWQDVMECQEELAKFIAPVRDEYEKMLSALKSLDENCSQLEMSLRRDGTPVFQTARYLRAKIENLEKDIDDIRKLSWKRSDLQRNYYFLWQRLRDLGSEVEQIRRMDGQESAEMQALEKEYKNVVREYARRVHAGNDAAIRKEIASGDVFLKSLADQYKTGRKNGTDDPSALDVRARLQRKIEACKQQIMDFNIARMDDAIREQERARQFMPTGKEIPVPINKTEFITTIFRLITDLQKITAQSTDIEDAIEELRLAHTEARKSRPNPAELKRFMNSAKGILVEVEKIVPEVGLVIGAIAKLTGVIPKIFT
jgi:hypothetical protein